MTNHQQSDVFGISGMAMTMPPYRVQLEQWCAWTGNSWDKTRAVVGHSFRLCGHEHSMYTMAADAVLKLILNYKVDPRRVGYLALGTESSTDNAAGAVIVRGLVDRALQVHGLPRIAVDCEVPEFKQACLGGVYGVKGALRYLAHDGRNRLAIVVASDIAEYARGSTGEPTQGAGAVACLLERNPTLLALDLRHGGSASNYRTADFRKPFLRYFGQTATPNARPRDYPVFNGKYSTACYTEETLQAFDSMFSKREGSRAAYLRSLKSVFMHRPYYKMPVTAWALGYLFALARDGASGRDELAEYCKTAQVDIDALLAEVAVAPDISSRAAHGDLAAEAYPLANLVVKGFQKSPMYKTMVDEKMKLGAAPMMDCGNLYSASVLAWLFCGMAEAERKDMNLDEAHMLLVGYGSGDASEAIPMTVMPEWRTAAKALNLEEAFSGAVDLVQPQYEALHDGLEIPLPAHERKGFTIDRIGERDEPHFVDMGIEYHAYSH